MHYGPGAELGASLRIAVSKSLGPVRRELSILQIRMVNQRDGWSFARGLHSDKCWEPDLEQGPRFSSLKV